VEIIKEKGLNDPEVLKKSQILDDALNEYYWLLKEKKR